MTANELRIGNLLYYKNTVDIAIVELIHKNNFDCRDINGSFTPNGNYESIPLTEEWLLKLGFRRSSNTLMFFPMPKIQAELHYERHNYGNVITIQSDFGMLIPDDIEYVHQLQNLYFALTGQELEVKP